MTASLSSGARYTARRAARAGKWLRQRLRAGPHSPAPLYVVGCQRSGTTMVMNVLERSRDTWVYHEQDRRAFRAWRLRPAAERRELLRRARCRWVVFKPLQDSQRLDTLLEEDENARALWVFRRYEDVARSWTAKWGDDLHEALRRLALEPSCDHWMAERMPPDRRRLVTEIFHEGLSIPSNAALRWYLRNEIFFDLGLEHRSDRVLPLRYEDLVADPQGAFLALFDFLELPFEATLASEVSPRPALPAADIEIDPRVRDRCEELSERLYQASPPRASLV